MIDLQAVWCVYFGNRCQREHQHLVRVFHGLTLHPEFVSPFEAVSASDDERCGRDQVGSDQECADYRTGNYERDIVRHTRETSRSEIASRLRQDDRKYA